MPTPEQLAAISQGFNKKLGQDPNAPQPGLFDTIKTLLGASPSATPTPSMSPPADPKSALGQLQQGIDSSTLGNPSDPAVQARIQALRRMQMQGQ